MAFTANDYILDAAELYGDTAYDRIETTTWIKYLNAAIRTLILVRPDAGAVTESTLLVSGIKQTLPTAALRLLDDIFFEAIVQFILYKALSADDDSIDSAKAQQHFLNFTTLLGVEQQSSRTQGPETKE
mgnify:CR=1 FL=1